MDNFDLAVVGGGLAGAATACFAALSGARVVLIERRDLNLAASGSNAGSIHAQIPFDPFRTLGAEWARAYARTIPLFMASIERWKELESELGGGLGVSTRGGLMVAGSRADLGLLEEKADIERAAGLPVEMWSRAELAAREPFLTDDLCGAAFCPIEGKADPLKAAPLFALRAREAGCLVLRDHPVEAIERVAGGFLLRAGGREIMASRIVNAAGAEAARIAAMVGVEIALEGHPIQVAVTEKGPAELPWLLYYTGEKLTLKQAADGGYLIGGGWSADRARDGDPTGARVNGSSMARNLAVAARVLPGLSDLRVVRSWAAVVNGTADWRPILGETPGVPGFFLNLFPWMGFTAAPAVSEAIADLALGRRPAIDLAEFCPPPATP